ncbi:hypothetical protein [Nocardia vermiculata]|uniref:Uncharacterized protein n=1 Tax=Nocardia vermiculata TaxID=257274 RepID=A0A846XYN5_9NOCA|nr:hypothetical protein [Nocardia vermiculata]NKY50178.1 hypothetical protein [Nocardia vermiculata]
MVFCAPPPEYCSGPLSITYEHPRPGKPSSGRFVVSCVCGYTAEREPGDEWFMQRQGSHLTSGCEKWPAPEPATRRGQLWTAEEDAQVWDGTVREVAARLKRSRSAVQSRRLVVKAPQ